MQETAILIDPTISDEGDLIAIGEAVKLYPNSKVYIFLSTLQHDYLSTQGTNPVINLENYYPREERIKDAERLFSYWNRLIRLSAPGPSYVPEGKACSLNIPRFYSASMFDINGLLLSTVLCLLKYAPDLNNSNVIVIYKEPLFLSLIEGISSLFNFKIIKSHLLKSKKKSLLPFTSIISILFQNIFNRSRLACGKKPSGKTVYIDRYRHTEPVIEALKKQKDISIHAGYLFFLNEFFQNTSVWDAAQRSEKELRERMDLLLDTHPLEGENPSWAEILKICVEILKNRAVKAMHRIFLVWDYFDYLKPDIVVCLNWVNYDQQAMRAWSKTHSVPFYVIQHGIHCGGVASTSESLIDADSFFCWGEGMKESFEKACPDNAGLIECTGNPLYNHKQETIFSNRADNKISILVAPSESGYLLIDASYDFWNEIHNLVLNFPNIKWIIRPHAQYSFPGFIEKTFRQSNVVISSPYKEDIFSPMKEVGVVITTVSTVALDAMHMGKPVIIINNTGQPELFTQYGAGIVLTKTKDIKGTIDKFIAGNMDLESLLSAQGNFIRDFGQPDGKKKILDAINGALQNNRAIR